MDLIMISLYHEINHKNSRHSYFIPLGMYYSLSEGEGKHQVQMRTVHKPHPHMFAFLGQAKKRLKKEREKSNLRVKRDNYCCDKK